MQPRGFREFLRETLPIGGQVTLSGGETATVLFHTENMEHALSGVRVQYADGAIEDVSYGDIVSPNCEYIPPSGPGRPVERAGLYRRVSLDIRADLYEAIRARGESRRELIERLLEQEFASKP